jgi:hypothetical protein
MVKLENSRRNETLLSQHKNLSMKRVRVESGFVYQRLTYANSHRLLAASVPKV